MPAPTDEEPFRLEFYRDEGGVEPVLDWLRSLESARRRAIGVAMHEILGKMGVEVCGTEFGKQLGQGLFEFRVRQSANQILARAGHAGKSEGGRDEKSILLRVYCHAHGDRVILLLAGYDKGRDASAKRENREIALARKRLAEFRGRQER
jgi:phage-related protein